MVRETREAGGWGVLPCWVLLVPALRYFGSLRAEKCVLVRTVGGSRVVVWLEGRDAPQATLCQLLGRDFSE